MNRAFTMCLSLFVMVVLPQTGFAKTNKNKVPPAHIQCVEFNPGGNDDGSDQNLATIDVSLDAQGNAAEIRVDRIAIDGNEPIKINLGKQNAEIQHDIQ